MECPRFESLPLNMHGPDILLRQFQSTALCLLTSSGRMSEIFIVLLSTPKQEASASDATLWRRRLCLRTCRTKDKSGRCLDEVRVIQYRLMAGT